MNKPMYWDDESDQMKMQMVISRDKRIAELEATLTWYGEQARLCRLIHSEGDAGRQALADDGGKRARDVLER